MYTIKVGTHDGTSPCDKSLQQVAGTSPIVCADLYYALKPIGHRARLRENEHLFRYRA